MDDGTRKNLVFVLDYHHLGDIVRVRIHQLGVEVWPSHQGTLVLSSRKNLAENQSFLIIGVGKSSGWIFREVIARTMRLSFGFGYVKVGLKNTVNVGCIGTVVGEDW